jgi:orotidine-5'-phosphate decarboxylase
MTNSTAPRVIVALDYPSADAARAFVAGVDPTLCRLKVGKELFTRSGPALVAELVDMGFDVFLDLKFHDIPNTAAQACAAAADLGVWMMNVHASGGRRMMDAAREMLERRGGQRPLLIGVTVLTSMGAEDLAEVGVPVAPADQVLRLAGLAHKAGLDGVVCSPKESALLRHRLGEDFLLVTPGVRPAGADIGDQKRVLSPREAVQQGSDYLVVGRPVTQAADPVAVLRAINTEIAP